MTFETRTIETTKAIVFLESSLIAFESDIVTGASNVLFLDFGPNPFFGVAVNPFSGSLGQRDTYNLFLG